MGCRHSSVANAPGALLPTDASSPLPEGAAASTDTAGSILAVHEQAIVVLVRLRHLNDKEKKEGATSFITLQSPTQVRAHNHAHTWHEIANTFELLTCLTLQCTLPMCALPPLQLLLPASKLNPAERAFAYDAVLPEGASQSDVYTQCGPRLLAKALQGYDATLFAYGQTGTLTVRRRVQHKLQVHMPELSTTGHIAAL
jgi:Kinesin motor domain